MDNSLPSITPNEVKVLLCNTRKDVFSMLSVGPKN
jgi:hypothetical protein